MNNKRDRSGACFAHALVTSKHDALDVVLCTRVIAPLGIKPQVEISPNTIFSIWQMVANSVNMTPAVLIHMQRVHSYSRSYVCYYVAFVQYLLGTVLATVP